MPQPTAATVRCARGGAVRAPTPEVVGYVRRLLRRRYHASLQDADDLIGQALLDFVVAARRGRPCQDGLFLVIANRRACDFFRRRRTEVPLGARWAGDCALDECRLDEEALRRRLREAVLAAGRLDKRRILGITDEILAGASFPEACRAIGVPRGSQGRYRHALRDILSAELATTPSLHRNRHTPPV